MKTVLKIELEKASGETDEFEIVADQRDIRKYEAEFKASWITSDSSATQNAQLAWIAARRLGKFKGSYDDWDAVCADIRDVTGQQVAEEAGEVPNAGSTRRKATANSS